MEQWKKKFLRFTVPNLKFLSWGAKICSLFPPQFKIFTHSRDHYSTEIAVRSRLLLSWLIFILNLRTIFKVGVSAKSSTKLSWTLKYLQKWKYRANILIRNSRKTFVGCMETSRKMRTIEMWAKSSFSEEQRELTAHLQAYPNPI